MQLTPADPRDLAFAIQYALNYGLTGKRLGKTPVEASTMAAHILEHLTRCGYVVMQGPPARPFTKLSVARAP